jgi:hypothetical protein
VRFMVGRDEDVLQWLESNYGGIGGPEILQALRDANPPPSPPSRPRPHRSLPA